VSGRINAGFRGFVTAINSADSEIGAINIRPYGPVKRAEWKSTVQSMGRNGDSIWSILQDGPPQFGGQLYFRAIKFTVLTRRIV